jgi:uncharacterized protein involved in outer membrane biogenesis
VKWIIRILVILVVLIGGFLVSSYWWLDGAAKKAIEVAGSDAMGTTVTLDKISIGVLKGSASLKKFHIANPEGYEKPFFFDLQEGATEVDLGTVMKETIEIPSIELSGLTMYLEPGPGGKYNYEKILDNVEKYTKSDTPKEESEKQIKIKRIAIRDIKVYYKTKVFVTTPVHVKEIVLNDVGSDGSGVDMGELISIILAGTLRGIADELPGAIGNGIKAGVGKLGEIGGVAAKAVVDVAGKGVEKVGEGVEKVGEGAAKGIKKLLGGGD